MWLRRRKVVTDPKVWPPTTGKKTFKQSMVKAEYNTPACLFYRVNSSSAFMSKFLVSLVASEAPGLVCMSVTSVFWCIALHNFEQVV